MLLMSVTLLQHENFILVLYIPISLIMKHPILNLLCDANYTKN